MTPTAAEHQRQRSIADSLVTLRPPPFPDRDVFPRSWAEAMARLMVERDMTEEEAFQVVQRLSLPNLEMPADWFARATEEGSEPLGPSVGETKGLTLRLVDPEGKKCRRCGRDLLYDGGEPRCRVHGWTSLP